MTGSSTSRQGQRARMRGDLVEEGLIQRLMLVGIEVTSLRSQQLSRTARCWYEFVAYDREYWRRKHLMHLEQEHVGQESLRVESTK